MDGVGKGSTVMARMGFGGNRHRGAGSPQVPFIRTLLRVGHTVNASLDPEQVLRAVLEELAAAVHAASGTIWLRDEAGRTVRPRAMLGAQAESLRRVTLRPGEGIVGRAMVTQRGVIESNPNANPNWASWVDGVTGFRTQSILCVPLSCQGWCIGAIEFVNHLDGSGFTRADLALATALAHQAGIAVKHSLLYEARQRSVESLVATMAALAEAREPLSKGHGQRVGRHCRLLAESFGLPDNACRNAEWAGLLHDIGKVGTPDELLLKADPLTPFERDMVRSHSERGAELLARLEPADELRPVVLAVRHHHERYDGTGYPHGLVGDAIPALARMVAIADAFDAMTQDRPYRGARSTAEAIDEVRAQAGSQFDPDYAEAFAQMVAAAASEGPTDGQPPGAGVTPDAIGSIRRALVVP